jgi:hypothetical protein
MPELPARLASVLERRRDAVEAWGFKLRGQGEAAGAGALRLLRAPVVMGKALGANDLVDYLEELADAPGRRLPPPLAVRRAMASRACRGAIMFGDRLPRAASARLVRQLARCALPFQCAHGRPSMVPLLTFGDHSPARRPAVPGGAGTRVDGAACAGNAPAGEGGAAAGRVSVARGSCTRGALGAPDFSRIRGRLGRSKDAAAEA